jgi:hypothetical protein
MCRALTPAVCLMVAVGCMADVEAPLRPEGAHLVVAVVNHNPYAVTVRVEATDGRALHFDDLLAGGTSARRTVASPGFGIVTVRCVEGGCEEGALALEAGPQTLHLLEGEPPSLQPFRVRRPSVVETVPADGTANVGLNATVTVTFSQPMREATLQTSTNASCAGSLQLSSDGFVTCIPARVEALGDRVVRLRPTAPLEALAAHAVRVTTDAASSEGRGLEAAVRVRFTTGPDEDEVPPGSVEDLAVASLGEGRVELTWTAVGDDDGAGRASAYALRSAPGRCPLAHGDATVVETPTPAAAGATERVWVEELPTGRWHCFELDVLDEVPNSSGSNPVEVFLPSVDDVTPPSAPRLTPLAVSDRALSLTWIAVGDDGEVGRAARQELRYLPASSCPAHDGASFLTGNPGPALPRPAPAGEVEEARVQGLLEDTAYCFVLAVADDAGNVVFSPPQRGRTLPEIYW